MVRLPGRTYTFDGFVFDNGQPGLPVTQYGVTNRDPNPRNDMLTAGLAQVPKFDGDPQGLNPINATGVPHTRPTQFTPIEMVYVFTQDQLRNGLVISTVPKVALPVDLTQNPSQTIYCNDDTVCRFVPGALP